MRVEGPRALHREAEARPASGITPDVPQPEDSETSSTTPSEIQCATNYWRRKTSLRNSAFLDREFNALSAVDAYLGATRGAFNQSLNFLSQGLRVKLHPRSYCFGVSCISLFV